MPCQMSPSSTPRSKFPAQIKRQLLHAGRIINMNLAPRQRVNLNTTMINFRSPYINAPPIQRTLPDRPERDSYDLLSRRNALLL